MTAYYNEIDQEKAAWLRELIRTGVIAAGDVDERSVKDVRPDDLRGYTQCHFFAGIGIWSYALRLAGWPDDRPVWTGSCPCQDLSAAGKKAGFDGERHLWPHWFPLIRELRPVVVLGEQVASPLGLAWIDLVHSDLEGSTYTVGAVDTCAAGFGAPHIRQRLYWMAYDHERGRTLEREARLHGDGQPRDDAAGCGEARGVAHAGRASDERRGGPGHAHGEARALEGEARERQRRGAHTGDRGATGGLALADGERGCRGTAGREDAGDARLSGEAGPVNGWWADALWLPCADGKARPAEPGTFPLAYGAPASLLRLRGYGDGIVAPQAAAFVEAVMCECHARGDGNE